MKFGFVTCVQLGLTCMEAIYEAGGALEVVLTLPDATAAAKSGRVYVDEFCARHHVDLVKVRNVNDEAAVAAIRSHHLDWLFVIGWSQIVRRPVLEAARRGVIGIHPTLLPEGRGRAAIPWAILKGLGETGVTMFALDEGVDTGPILAQLRLPIAPDETASTLYRRVAEAHGSLIRQAWGDFMADRIVLRPQDSSLASEWPGRRPEDGIILPGTAVADGERLIRATTRPYPGAFWNGEQGVLRIWRGVIGNEAETPPVGARRIRLRDGVIDALEYDVES